MTAVHGMEIGMVTRGLYQGSKPPPGQLPFAVLVLAAKEYQPEIHKFPGVREVIHCPLDDAALSQSEATAAVSVAKRLARHILAGATVLVTCNQGRNRSGLISALTLLRLNGRMTAGRACHMVRRARGPNALTNPSFVKFLNTVAMPGEDAA